MEFSNFEFMHKEALHKCLQQSPDSDKDIGGLTFVVGTTFSGAEEQLKVSVKSCIPCALSPSSLQTQRSVTLGFQPGT